MQVTVEIPDRFVDKLLPAGRDAARSLLEGSVAGAYRDQRLTMEQVRQLLGFATRIQVDAFLQQHQIYDYSIEDLDKDLATLDRALSKSRSMALSSHPPCDTRHRHRSHRLKQ
jgi:Uncharacterised protein family (UPF0175)